MKGIILAGGTGSRLYPNTLATSKQLLPVYDKPMIYYPLSVLMLAGIREILIISTAEDLPRFQRLFGSGEELGLCFSYQVQLKPEGIAQAFLLAEEFIAGESVSLILGDNIFYGSSLRSLLQNCVTHDHGGIIFGYQVHNPSRYGVIDFDEAFKVRGVVEKPENPPSSFAITGLYFYDHQVVSIAKNLKPSKRGELEITDVNQIYLEKGQLQVKLFEKGFAWLDTGTHDALHKASSYVQTIQERQGIQIACIEELAFINGWISLEQLESLAVKYQASEYGLYLKAFVKEAGSLTFSF
ncbi:MAG: glucose-1-phosphate thymidylyltransferase RfbA [Chlamydiota bacterium]